MELQFLAQNAHFAINLFAALVFFAMCWLHADAWSAHRTLRGLLKWVGFGLAGLSFLARSTSIEQTILGSNHLSGISETTSFILGALGYAGIVAALIMEPLMARPTLAGLVLEEDKTTGKLEESKPDKKTAAPAMLAGPATALHALLPLGALAAAGLYWRQATTGLERHLKPVARGFLVIAVSEAIHLTSFWRGTDNPILYDWIRAFGWVWWLEQLVLFAGALMLGLWVWSYLTKRFFSELFMIFTSMVVGVFLVTGVSFTFLLLRNIKDTSLNQVATAGQVVDYALRAKQAETNAAAKQLAADHDIVTAITAKNHAELVSLTNNYLSEKKLSGLTITNISGQVLLRAHDPSRWGDSLSNDLLIKRAAEDYNQSSIMVGEGAGVPTVEVRSATSVKDGDGKIIGVVMSQLALDSAFVDGLKQATGLETAIYGKNVLAATTSLSNDGKSRVTGTAVNDKTVMLHVLEKGEHYKTPLTLQNRPVFAAFSPLKDADDATVGMLLVAEKQSNILKTAGKSVELTFLLTAVLLIVSIPPIYLISNRLVKQL